MSTSGDNPWDRHERAEKHTSATPPPGGGILTVNGWIEPEALGFCQPHEHLFVKSGPASEKNPDLCLDDMEKTGREVGAYLAAGGNSIVDAQPIGSGRMAESLLQISRQTDLQIVAVTGFHRPMFYDDNHWVRKASGQQLTELFIEELQSGMYADGEMYWPRQRLAARAGAVKMAAGEEGISGRWEVLFSSAAEAAAATGAPVLCHLEGGQQVLHVLAFLQSRGVSPEQVILCHLDRQLKDLPHAMEAASMGAWLELDTIGRFKYHDDESEASFIEQLLEEGYESRILMGLDTTRARMKNYGGTIGLDYLLRSFLPMLREKGISETVLEGFMHRNPAVALTWKS